MRRQVWVFLAGVLFSLGLGVAGMTRADKVIAFLDLTDWDPSLALVMAGASGTYMALHRWVLRRQRPLFAGAFHLPTRRDVTLRLMLGSALFGVGWGLGGYCPGPGVVSLASGTTPTLVFGAAMLAGMATFHLVQTWRGEAATPRPRRSPAAGSR